MRDAMEVVASRVDELGKSKIVPLPPQPAPTTKPKTRRKKGETAYAEWDRKQYKGTEQQRRQERENRRLIREVKQKEAEAELARKVQALQPLGNEDDDEQEEEETEAPPEPDPPVPPVPEKPSKTRESTGARNKRLEMERRREAKEKREAERTKAATKSDDPKPKPKGKSPARSSKGTKKPKEKPDDDGATSREVAGRSSKGAKTPKETEKPKDDASTSREVAGKTQDKRTKGKNADDDATSRSVAAKASKTKHVDDDEYDLDLNTGKFIKKTKKPVVRDDDDDDDDIEMEEIDDEDKDADYDPDKEVDQGDDDDDKQEIEQDEDDDDDFPVPPLRSKKSKPSDESTSKKKKQKPSDEALEDLADFAEETFRKPTRQIKRKGGKQESCINLVEAARFRKAMQDEVLELEKAVRKGTNIAETYQTMVTHIIQACKDMNYDIPVDIEVEDIFPTIEDPTCKAWQLKLQGVQTAGEGELNVSKTDNSGVCVAKRKFGIKDVMAYVEEVSSDWMELKRKSFIATMKKVMGNMAIAHRMVAEASQEMISLLDEVDLPLWIKLAYSTMRPLVHIEVPEVTIMCEQAKQISKENEQHWDQTTKITTIMEAKSLPFLPTSWGYNKEGRAKKVIAGIIYKYVKDRMYEGKIETPAMEVSEKFALNSTTMNRHILGKKYEGGKASSSKPRRPIAQKITATERLVDKSKRKTGVEADEDEGEEPQDKSTKKAKGKGSGKSSRVTRSAKEIRDESTSDKQKQKAKKHKVEEAVVLFPNNNSRTFYNRS